MTQGNAMKRRLAAIAAVSFLTLPASAKAADGPDDRAEAFRAFLEDFRRAERVPSLSVAVVESG